MIKTTASVTALCLCLALAALGAAPARADIISNDTTPGNMIVGKVTRIGYDDNGIPVYVVVTDKKNNDYFIFDGSQDNDLTKYHTALAVAFTAGAKVTLMVSGNDVTEVELSLQKKKKSASSGRATG